MELSDSTEALTCFHCGKAVLAHEAMPLVFERQDGHEYNVVFHRPPLTCAMDWSLVKLESLSTRLQQVLNNFEDAARRARENNEQL